MIDYIAYYKEKIAEAKDYFTNQRFTLESQELVIDFARAFGYGIKDAPEDIRQPIIVQSYQTLYVANVSLVLAEIIIDAKTWIDAVYDGMDKYRYQSV